MHDAKDVLYFVQSFLKVSGIKRDNTLAMKSVCTGYKLDFPAFRYCILSSYKSNIHQHHPSCSCHCSRYLWATASSIHHNPIDARHHVWRMEYVPSNIAVNMPYSTWTGPASNRCMQASARYRPCSGTSITYLQYMRLHSSDHIWAISTGQVSLNST